MRPLILLLAAAIAPAIAAPALDALLPPGATAVLGLRTSALLNLLSQQDGAQAMRMQISMLLAATPFAGFDPFSDIDEVVIALTGSGQNPPSLAIITGRFDAAKLSQGKGRPYRNVMLLEDPKSKQVVAILDQNTLLAGELPMVRSAIDRLSAKAAAGPLAARIEALRPRYDVWALADHIDTAAMSAAMPAAARSAADPLRGLDRLSFGATFTNNFELAAEFHLRSTQDAEAAAAFLRGLEKQAKSQMTGAGAPSVAFDLQASGNSVKLAVSIPEAEWKQALRAGMKPAPQPPAKPQSREPVVTTDGNGNTLTVTLPGKRQ